MRDEPGLSEADKKRGVWPHPLLLLFQRNLRVIHTFPRDTLPEPLFQAVEILGRVHHDAVVALVPVVTHQVRAQRQQTLYVILPYIA